ncbi:EamA family transporter RarD [Ferrovibrio sp. MS7]|uniref:EamA family transporter RarD n=1 Tax=Ferrovibrio plantarum TaxID=3119164 RepID=UPI001B68858A|nr:EamA family transporter RarD [Ferrovibrio sp.]
MGILFAAIAYCAWGLSPLYFRMAGFMTPLEITAQRVLWACLLCFVLLAAMGKLPLLARAVANRRLVGVLAITSAMMLLNWLLFVYAIDTRQVMSASLGYYINPLVAVLLGRLVLKEKVNPVQWAMLALAAVGVTVLGTAAANTGIWISLAIAISWGIYALLRKRNPVDSLVGFTVEILLPLPIAIGYLAWHGGGALGPAWNGLLSADLVPLLLLVFAGVITAIPLVAFGAGQSRLTMASMGLMQYISPTLQFLLATLLWGESFTSNHAIAFSCIWVAVGVFSFENWRRARRAAATG